MSDRSPRTGKGLRFRRRPKRQSRQRPDKDETFSGVAGKQVSDYFRQACVSLGRSHQRQDLGPSLHEPEDCGCCRPEVGRNQIPRAHSIQLSSVLSSFALVSDHDKPKQMRGGGTMAAVPGRSYVGPKRPRGHVFPSSSLLSPASGRRPSPPAVVAARSRDCAATFQSVHQTTIDSVELRPSIQGSPRPSSG